jgi:hypothetical protein
MLPPTSRDLIIVSPLFDARGYAKDAKTTHGHGEDFSGGPRDFRKLTQAQILSTSKCSHRETIKKRLRLFSPRRLGSPPPELPNHEMDVKELLI